MHAVTILGATGTIGQQTLDVIAQHPSRFSVYALTAQQNVDILFAQCKQFKPRYAVLLQEKAADELRAKLTTYGSDTEVLCGKTALIKVAADREVDIVMAAIVGAAGLASSIAAAYAGKRVLLANKETLVMAGHFFMQAVHEGGAELLPIDSEHNAIFQVMPVSKTRDLNAQGIKRILLTASGGPFRNHSMADLQQVTLEQALQHPNWKMGAKITIDSATMMNKGLEVIEAHWLFNASHEQIEVVVHPESVIHSMVEYVDGSVLAQMGNPDMRTPIAYGLGYPDRLSNNVKSLDLFKIGQLNFEKPDTLRFPCLRLAFEALKMGGTTPSILNAANEVAVASFLANKIRFMQIAELIETTLANCKTAVADDLETIIEADKHARLIAQEWLLKKGFLPASC